MKGILKVFQLNHERCSRRKYAWDYWYPLNEFYAARPFFQQMGVSGDLQYAQDKVNLFRKVHNSAVCDICKTASVPRQGYIIF